MIYLDNSATSYPKPQCVIDGMTEAMVKYGANSGRGMHQMAMETSEQVYKCRKNIASFFNIKNVENVIFTYNCTMALNLAIKGVAKKGCNFVISDLEHNAVVRPLESLKQKGICDYSIARVEKDAYSTLKNFEKCINDNTVAIICTGASNVFGTIPPYKSLSLLAHKYKLLFIMDCSQIAGIIPLDMTGFNIDILCCSGHKGLMGPTGIGLLILNNNLELNTIIEGGTGSNSMILTQPTNYPDRLESGTPNIVGIIGLSKALDYLKNQNMQVNYAKEISLLKHLQYFLMNDDRFIVYTNLLKNNTYFAPILSFNVKGKHSEEIANYLSDAGIAVRAGLHCAPLAHLKFKTDEIGTVRISPSIFNKKSDIDLLIKSLFEIAK